MSRTRRRMTVKTIDDLVNLVQEYFDAQDADGCEGCAFEDRDEWEMPCARCKRNCKDYWRPKKEED